MQRTSGPFAFKPATEACCQCKQKGVYAQVYVHVFTHVFMHVRAHVYAHVCAHVFMHVHTCSAAHGWLYIDTHVDV